MTHQFHSAFHTVSDEGGVLNIGPAAVSIDIANMHVFMNAVGEIESKRQQEDPDNRNYSAASAILAESDWGMIGYVAERDSYSIRYRGVAWEAAAAVAVAAAAEVRAFFEAKA